VRDNSERGELRFRVANDSNTLSQCLPVRPDRGALVDYQPEGASMYVRPANDVRIDCKAAKHGDGDRGAPVAPNREWKCERRAARERGLL